MGGIIGYGQGAGIGRELARLGHLATMSWKLLITIIGPFNSSDLGSVRILLGPQA